MLAPSGITVSIVSRLEVLLELACGCSIHTGSVLLMDAMRDVLVFCAAILLVCLRFL